MLQVLLFCISIITEKTTKPVLLSPYSPWLSLGETLERNSGAGGHAFAGGVIIGLLAGVLVYSLLIGAVLGCIYESKIRPHISFSNLK